MSAETGVVFTHDPLLRNHTVRRFSEDDVLECLAAIPCPTLLIYAGDPPPPNYNPLCCQAPIRSLVSPHRATHQSGAFLHSLKLRSPRRGCKRGRTPYRTFAK
jgi:hypothetical protein